MKMVPLTFDNTPIYKLHKTCYICVNNGCLSRSIAEGLSSCLPSKHLNNTSRSAGLRFSGISGGDSAQAI